MFFQIRLMHRNAHIFINPFYSQYTYVSDLKVSCPPKESQKQKKLMAVPLSRWGESKTADGKNKFLKTFEEKKFRQLLSSWGGG